jgi:hypothetical protein
MVSGCDASPVLQLAEQAFDDKAARSDGVRREAVEGMAVVIVLCCRRRRRLLAR